MSYAPMMNALTEEETTSGELHRIIESRYSSFSIYDFKCFMEKDDVIINDDYMYLRFYVNGAGDKISGGIDYCLNLSTQHFSYREFIALTMKTGEEYEEPAILAIQLDDVAIDQNGSFSVKNKNAIVDILSIDEYGNGFLLRTYPVMKSEGGELAVFIRPTETEYWHIAIGEEVKASIRKAFGDDYIIDNEEEASGFGHKKFGVLFNQYYGKKELLADYDPRLGGNDVYSSYQEYLDDSIRELKNNTLVTDTGLYSAEEFIVFDYNEGIAATLRTRRYAHETMGHLVDCDKTALESMGFDQFYPDVFDDFKIENFIEAHLRNAGAEDDYIKSYITDWETGWNAQR